MYKSRQSTIERDDAHLHGWDAQAEAWHGPIPLTQATRATRLTARIRNARGSFQGKLRCSVPGLPCIEFHTALYDLKDTGLAIVHLDGAESGPAGILAVIPSHRRKILRNDFAFELMTVISFLGAPVNSGSELAIHDYIEETLRTAPSAAQIFAVEMAELTEDTGIVLSAFFEQLASAMLNWMACEETPEEAECTDGEFDICTTIPGAGRPPASVGCFAV